MVIGDVFSRLTDALAILDREIEHPTDYQNEKENAERDQKNIQLVPASSDF
jgi:hypothetical protein